MRNLTERLQTKPSSDLYFEEMYIRIKRLVLKSGEDPSSFDKMFEMYQGADDERKEEISETFINIINKVYG